MSESYGWIFELAIYFSEKWDSIAWTRSIEKYIDIYGRLIRKGLKNIFWEFAFEIVEFYWIYKIKSTCSWSSTAEWSGNRSNSFEGEVYLLCSKENVSMNCALVYWWRESCASDRKFSTTSFHSFENTYSLGDTLVTTMFKWSQFPHTIS